MNESTLVNINVPIQTLRGFDHLCRLLGKTRTAVLVDIMRSFMLREGRNIIEQVQEISSLARTADKPDKTRVERRTGVERCDPPKAASKSELRRFSDVIADETGFPKTADGQPVEVKQVS